MGWYPLLKIKNQDKGTKQKKGGRLSNDIMPSIKSKYWRDKDNGANEERTNDKLKRNSKPWGPRHSGLF